MAYPTNEELGKGYNSLISDYSRQFNSGELFGSNPFVKAVGQVRGMPQPRMGTTASGAPVPLSPYFQNVHTGRTRGGETARSNQGFVTFDQETKGFNFGNIQSKAPAGDMGFLAGEAETDKDGKQFFTLPNGERITPHEYMTRFANFGQNASKAGGNAIGEMLGSFRQFVGQNFQMREPDAPQNPYSNQSTISPNGSLNLNMGGLGSPSATPPMSGGGFQPYGMLPSLNFDPSKMKIEAPNYNTQGPSIGVPRDMDSMTRDVRIQGLGADAMSMGQGINAPQTSQGAQPAQGGYSKQPLWRTSNIPDMIRAGKPVRAADNDEYLASALNDPNSPTSQALARHRATAFNNATAYRATPPQKMNSVGQPYGW